MRVLSYGDGTACRETGLLPVTSLTNLGMHVVCLALKSCHISVAGSLRASPSQPPPSSCFMKKHHCICSFLFRAFSQGSDARSGGAKPQCLFIVTHFGKSLTRRFISVEISERCWARSMHRVTGSPELLWWRCQTEPLLLPKTDVVTGRKEEP